MTGFFNPFHWPLAFPEVFGGASGGFDVFVGNVPFLGGTRISGAMGESFRNYIANFIGVKSGGRADLAAYFFLNAYKLLGDDAIFGLLTTNTISEGDTRQVGLETILAKSQSTIVTAYFF